jgi:hypothetical protein
MGQDAPVIMGAGAIKRREEDPTVVTLHRLASALGVEAPTSWDKGAERPDVRKPHATRPSPEATNSLLVSESRGTSEARPKRKRRIEKRPYIVALHKKYARIRSRYSRADFDRMAKALGIMRGAVENLAEQIDGASLSFWLDRGVPRRIAPSKLRRQLQQVAQAARKLLHHLGVDRAEARNHLATTLQGRVGS